jgi:O-antigen/teichoic acid export membrane protein
VTLLVATLFTVVLVVAAEPIIQLFGGSAFDAAIPVLRIQAFALLGASLTQAWIQGVVAVRGQRALVAVNVVALVSIIVLGAALIPPLGAKGASLAAVAGETILALAMLVALVRTRRSLLPDFGYVPRVALAGGVAAAAMLVPVPAAVQGVIAALVYIVAAWALRAIPVEVLHAFLRRDPVDAGAA